MDVIDAINKRRAYRSLAPLEISLSLIEDLARSAQLAPSCFNNQPWRFVFVYGSENLNKMQEALSSGNAWAHSASLIVAVSSRKEDDCVIKDREYYQFDCGLAAAFLILRATELGLVAHPIAGFSPKKTKEVLGIPEEYKVITLIIVGKRAETISSVLSENQIAGEKARPERKALTEITHVNQWKE